jgi:integrase
MRGITLRAMIGLAATTGLRISEVVALDRAHVDLRRNLLEICRSKFNKDRLVPIHDSTSTMLREYERQRDLQYPKPTAPAFFLQLWGGPFSKHTLQLSFWQLTRKLGLRPQTGEGPSFHDLRHTFAVRRLVAWYREGADVQAKLPALATYMGHAHYTDTAYYITAIPELMALAAERFNSVHLPGDA